MATVKNPYARETYHGKTMDVATIAAVKEAEGILGYELTITQGVGTSVGASAGTHAGLNGEGGRAVDFSSWDKARKLRVLKDVGFAIWFRPTIRGLWHEHLHGVLMLNRVDNHRGVADVAYRQIFSFLNRRDGLKSNREDNSYRPDPRAIFHYPPEEPPVPVHKKPLTEAKDKLVEAAHTLGEAAVLLDNAKRPSAEGRVRFDGYAATARMIRKTVNGLLRTLPKK